MGKIIRFLKREYYKLFYYESRGNDAMFGKFRVKYKDGKISQKMCWHSAKNYASIFNGEIIDAF
jgi:hypothetical protein